tara:strand:+ start:1008 stop:1166 length:159 start_codon:yes stop_codon:yes gene_type:complete
MMTRKHFVAIAKVLRENDAKHHLIIDLCDYFQSENPNFDREKFVSASKGVDY